MPRFQGVPVDAPQQAGGGRFGGQPVDAARAPQKPAQKPLAPKAAPKPQGYWEQRMAELEGFGQGARYSVAETALGVGQLLGGADEEDVAAFREKRARAAEEGGEFFDAGRFVGDTAQTLLPVGAAGKGVKALNYLRAGAGGAAYGASRPVVDGESRGMNAAVGAGANMTGQALGHGLAVMGKNAPPAVRQVYEAAKARGIPLTGAQVMDSEFGKRLAHLSDRLPFSGATGRRREQVGAVNREAAKLIGEQADSIDQGVMGQAYDRMGSEFDRLFAVGSPLDRTFLRDLANARRAVREDGATDAINAAEALVERIRRQGKSGQLSGKAFQSIDRQARRLEQSGDPDRAMLGEEIRGSLHALFARNNPAERPAFDNVRRQYANYKSLEPVVARNPEGPLPPTQLQGAVTRNQRGKARHARGDSGEIGELALIGNRMKGPQTSGTPEGMQTAAVGAGLWANPASTLALLLSGNTAGRALNSEWLARLLMSQNRGRFIAPLAPYARPLPLMLSGAAHANEPEGP